MSLTVLIITQIVVSVLLTITVLLQNGSTGGGLFDGASSGGESFRTKRGLEKFLYNATLVLAVALVILSFLIYRTK